MSLVDDIWIARESGENVYNETQEMYNSWYENYELLMKNTNASLTKWKICYLVYESLKYSV